MTKALGAHLATKEITFIYDEERSEMVIEPRMRRRLLALVKRLTEARKAGRKVYADVILLDCLMDVKFEATEIYDKMIKANNTQKARK